MTHQEVSAQLDMELERFFQAHPECCHPFLMDERQTLLDSRADVSSLDMNAFALFDEILSCRMGFNRDDSQENKTHYNAVCHQIYLFFTSDEYKEEKLTAAVVKEMVIPMAAVSLSETTRLDPVLVCAAISLILNTILKIGVRVWCEYYRNKHPELKP